MDSDKDNFQRSGPSHLTTVDWSYANHRRSVAASLIRGVSALERDRRHKRNPHLAQAWYRSFHFEIVGDPMYLDDHEIFGAVFEFKKSFASEFHLSIEQAPRYVIAFRGTMMTLKDLKTDLLILVDRLHDSTRFQDAMQDVKKKVEEVEDSDCWLAGHSMGAAIAMLIGKQMAKSYVYLNAFLFNPPYLSVPIEKMFKNKIFRGGFRLTNSFSKAIKLRFRNRDERSKSQNDFNVMSGWIPSLFVNGKDLICNGYIDYFKHRERMRKVGLRRIVNQTTQTTNMNLWLREAGLEPLRVLSSADLVINSDPENVHAICQWWSTNSDHLPLEKHRFL